VGSSRSCQASEKGAPAQWPGLHAGEIEIRGTDISGAVVNLAARVQHAAPDGHIYATTGSA